MVDFLGSAAQTANLIANPQIANVAGAAQLGREGRQRNLQFQQQQQALQQQQAQAAKQEEIKRLAGDILGRTLGSKIAGNGFDQLVRKDPVLAQQIAQGLGIPLDQKGRVTNLFGTASAAENIAKTVGLPEALQFVRDERDKIAAFGLPTPLMDKFVSDFESNPSEGLAVLAQFKQIGVESGILPGKVSEKEKAETARIKAQTKALGREDVGKGQFTLSEGQARFSPSGEVIAEIKDKADKADETGTIGFKDFRALNNDVTALIKEPLKIRNSAQRLEKIGKTKSPTDQLAAIFTFMKSLDPTSVVREGEQRQARSTGGVTDQFIGFVNRIVGEGALPPSVFEDMILTAKRLSNEAATGSRDQLESSLGAFGERLKKQDKDRLLKRVPGLFDIPTAPVVPTGVTPTTPSTQQRLTVSSPQLTDQQRSIIQSLRAGGATDDQINQFLGE